WEINWEIVKPLGGGGQGTTFLVRSTAGSGPSRAIMKTIVAHKASNLIARRRLSHEANALRELHKLGASVPKVFDDNTHLFDEESVRLFLVMEFIEGKLLSEWVGENKSPVT